MEILRHLLLAMAMAMGVDVVCEKVKEDGKIGEVKSSDKATRTTHILQENCIHA